MMKFFSAPSRSALPALALIALIAAGNAAAQMTMPGQAPAGASAPTPTPAPQAPPPGSGQGAGQGNPGPDPMTPEFRDCVKKTKEAMDAKKQEDLPAILGCLSSEVKRQEGRMSASAARAGKSLSAEEKKRLDEANTAWRRFRDANCSFYADPKGAPPASLENADCQLNLTIGRAQEMAQVAEQASRREAARAGKK